MESNELSRNRASHHDHFASKHCAEDKEGYVVVTGFSEKASNLALKGVQIGDRIVAVGSSVGDIMWPVSTVEGVVSACTARLPGQTVTMRFQRPMENLRLGTADDECTVADEPMVVVASRTAVAPTPTKTTTMTYEQEKQLLQRCCDVLKRYWSDSKTDFVGKNDIPALVADKVVDAVASASVSFDAVTLSMVMNAYLTCNQPDNAIRVFEASTGFSADGSDDSPNIVITGKERGTLLAKTDSLNLFTASSAMHAFAMKGDSSSAMRILAALEGQGGTTVDDKVVATWPRAGVAGSIQPDTISYNIALSAAAASINGATDLFAIFSGMSDGKSRGRRPARDIVSYNTVIAFLDGAGRSEEAFEVFSAMKQAGIKPDKFTYTSLVNSCSKPIDMQELLYDMKEVGVKPDIVTYNTMIRTLCDRLQWYEAKKMILDMEASGIAPNAMTYSFLMTGLLKAEKYSACLSLFESACADSRTMALTENVYLYTTAISAAASLRNHEKAFHLVNRMKAAGVRPNMKTMSALMSACLSSNMTSLAVEVYKQIENPDAKAMCNGLAAMCYEGAFDDVSVALFDQWRSRDSVMSGKQVMEVYSIMMRQVTEQGDWVAARSAFRQFLSCGFIPSKTMYQNIIEGLGLTPPRKRDLPFAKDIPLERFNFLLFVLDAIRDRNLSCDGGFYSAVLQCSSRMGGLRRKMGSLLAEARALSETTNLINDDHEKTSEIVRVGWEDLLVHYDDYKELTNVKLPHLSVNVHKNMIRQVLFAEQLVTHNGRKSLATRRTGNIQISARSK
jgi:pentatricopeptide repeat protein